PLIHNSAFRALDINAAFIPIRVPRTDLAKFLKDFDRLPVQGYAVTLPLKETAAQLALQKDEAVALTEAANTLLREDDARATIHAAAPGPAAACAGLVTRFNAHNTDIQAAIDSLLAKMPPGMGGATPTLHSKTVLILGAGGVARAIAHALH